MKAIRNQTLDEDWAARRRQIHSSLTMHPAKVSALRMLSQDSVNQ
jgi:hypothetical protein